MFTVFLTFVGIIVFFISLFTAKFTKAFWRLVAFVVTGFVIDVALAAIVVATVYFQQ